jgi:hypothetical protein
MMSPYINAVEKPPSETERITVAGIELLGKISLNSVPPMRILGHVLEQQGIAFRATYYANDPWALSQIIPQKYGTEKDAQWLKQTLSEIIEYRCSPELDDNYQNVIRQLPFAVAMATSDQIMAYGEYQELPELKKHLICRSPRGGYDIRTRGYEDRRLEGYLFVGNGEWD